jgi:hypothetical protein
LSHCTKKWATDYLATMKLVTDKDTVISMLAEILREYDIYEAEGEEEGNPFEADPEAGAEAGAGGGDAKDDKKDKEAAPAAPAGLTVSFNIPAVKRYNDVSFRLDKGEVKAITKDGLKVAVDGGAVVHVNFDDITNEQ